MNWTIERNDTCVATIAFRVTKPTARYTVLLTSDDHADNKQSDLGLIRKHHQQAVDMGAPILKHGDVMCAMEGKWDKRASESHMRPEMRGGNYLDRLVKFHADLYGPYAKNIAVISDGNHETAMLKDHQTDLLERLVDRLGAAGSPALHMPYTGFVRFRFQDGNRHAASKLLHYHHGFGGGGEVTRGLIDNNRIRSMYTADVYYQGNIHRRNLDENIMIGVNKAGQMIETQQLFLRGSCYKREHMEGSGYHIEKGRAGRPLGGWLLHFDVSRGETNMNITVTAEAAT
jgi:hypothetical protein